MSSSTSQNNGPGIILALDGQGGCSAAGRTARGVLPQLFRLVSGKLLPDDDDSDCGGGRDQLKFTTQYRLVASVRDIIMQQRGIFGLKTDNPDRPVMFVDDCVAAQLLLWYARSNIWEPSTQGHGWGNLLGDVFRGAGSLVLDLFGGSPSESKESKVRQWVQEYFSDSTEMIEQPKKVCFDVDEQNSFPEVDLSLLDYDQCRTSQCGNLLQRLTIVKRTNADNRDAHGICMSCVSLKSLIQLTNEVVVARDMRMAGFELLSTGHKFRLGGILLPYDYKGPDITTKVENTVYCVELDGFYHNHKDTFGNDIERMNHISNFVSGAGHSCVWIRIGYSRQLASMRRDWFDAVEQIVIACMDNTQHLIVGLPLFFYCNYNSSHWQFERAKRTFGVRLCHVEDTKKIDEGINFS